MFQINYNGLRKRDLYDEIVAILENDPTILKYPDRVPKVESVDIQLSVMNSTQR